MENKSIKVLVVSRTVWDESTASTTNNLFENLDKIELAHIYIETKKPNSSLCKSFFQISEYSLIKKIFKWRIKTGRKLDLSYVEDESIAKKEASTMDYVRHHRSFVYTVLREFLWLLNGWKTKELREFVREFNPDVVWFMGSPLILMNRLMSYVVKVAKKPYCVFEMDDVYNYPIIGFKPLQRLYRFFLRAIVKKLMKGVSQLFVISPKMKKEYDEAFHLNSLVLTKGIDFSKVIYHPYQSHMPIRLIYMGQVIYDRISTIEMIGCVLDEINAVEKHFVLSVYTTNVVDASTKEKMTKKGNVVFCDPVPYSEVKNVLSENDVVVFVESLAEKYKGVARLSFSTKITDYLASSKCILAVGPVDSAPIEYLKDNDAAFVASDKEELKQVLTRMLDASCLEAYSKKAFTCAVNNHDKETIDKMLYQKLLDVSNR